MTIKDTDISLKGIFYIIVAGVLVWFFISRTTTVIIQPIDLDAFYAQQNQIQPQINNNVENINLNTTKVNGVTTFLQRAIDNSNNNQ